MEKIKFSNEDVFFSLEEKAIDGALDYSGFPPEEYKYFSKLARLGHLNRHKGWSAEICEQKQEEFREQYREEKARSEKYLREIKRITQNRIRCTEAVISMNKADDIYGILDGALTALELIKDEPGFKDRINRRIEEMYEGGRR